MKGKFPCHADGALLIQLVKARMRKSRRTANGMTLTGLIPGHYLTLLSDLRDSVLYFGTSYFSPSACAVCVYHVLFFYSVWCKSTVTQYSPVRNTATVKTWRRDPHNSILNLWLIPYNA
jgi:hypothetical protein